MAIPEAYSGKISVVYKCAPPNLTGGRDEEIELPLGCEHLLALLSASYIWLDDDAERAQYYMNLYREAMSSLKRRGKDDIDSGYRIANG
jgi:hypothetical protein